MLEPGGAMWGAMEIVEENTAPSHEWLCEKNTCTAELSSAKTYYTGYIAHSIFKHVADT